MAATGLGFGIWLGVKEWTKPAGDPRFSKGYLSTSIYTIPTAVITGAFALLVTVNVDTKTMVGRPSLSFH